MRQTAVKYCETNDIGFSAFWSQHIETVARTETLKHISAEIAATPRQVALAWLLQRGSTTIVVPGTSSLEHLKENIAARAFRRSASQMRDLEDLGKVLR